MTTLVKWFASDILRAQAGAATMMKPKPQAMGPGGNKGTGGFQQDNTDMDNQNQAAQQPGGGGMGQPTPRDPSLTAAPYVKLLTKLGYEFQGHDEDNMGMPIGNTFQGPDGDMVYAKPDGSWIRFGPGANRSQGPDVNSLGQNLVRGALQQGDDQNTHGALRQAGYSKVHSDPDGNQYYKHPQSGNMVTVHKDGNWRSSVGSGRGSGKLQEFLGNEQFDAEDPNMQKMKMQKDQMKQQRQQQQGGGMGKPGTRGMGGTRPQNQGAAPGGMRRPPMGGGGRI